MPIFASNGTDIDGSSDGDIIVGIASGGAQTVSAGNGDDAVVAGHGFTFVDNGSGNGSLAAAINIDDPTRWATGLNPMVANDAVPYTTVVGQGGGELDWFAVTLAAGQTLTVDLDFAASSYGGTFWDPQVQIFNGSGTAVHIDDDSTPDTGGLGSFRYDPAINATRDTYLTYTAASAGTYYIALGAYGGVAPTAISASFAYLMNVSITGHAATGSVALDTLSTVMGEGGNDFLAGGGATDTIEGGDNDDLLYGAAGDDRLQGGAGNDLLDGGAGTDLARYNFATAAVTVDLAIAIAQNTVGAGSDTLAGIENLLGSDYADTLYGDDGNNQLDGSSGDDLLFGRGGNDSFAIGPDSGNDTIDGGTGYNLLDLGQATSPWTIDFVAEFYANLAGDTLVLAGISGVSGSAGDDSVRTSGGVIDFWAGGGNDVFYGGSDGSFDGGDGTDRFDMSGYDIAGDYTVNLADGFDSFGLALADVEDVFTGDSYDYIVGSAEDNVLRSGGDADTVYGGEGNDTTEGGAGNDQLFGESGFDYASYENATSAVTVTLASDGIAQNTLGAGTDTLTSFEALIGSAHNDTLTGDGFDNWLRGGQGGDVLSGGAGNDTFFWNQGDGSDTIDGGANTSGDIVYLLGAGSGWTVNLAAGTASNGTGDSLSLTGIEQVYGSNFNDDLTAFHLGGSTLLGFDGDDYIRIANSLPNTAYGGNGIDTLDTTNVIGVGLVYNLNLATGTSNFGETIAEFENLVSGETNDTVTGTGGANLIQTNAGSDTIFAGGGNDTINGGGGNDVIEGGAGNDIIDGGSQQDWASYASAGSAVSVSLTGAPQNTLGAGTDTLSNIENLEGSAYNDTLVGDGGGNQLRGGAGVDTMTGGGGNDVYYVDHKDDQTVEAPGGGTDTVSASADYTIGNEVENLTLTGAAIKGVGNGLNNVITGNANANLLYGGAGADSMAGGMGNDTYYVENAGDTVTEAVGAGGDTVSSSVSFTLGANIERLVLTGAAAINGTGNGLVNNITGNGAANILDGGAGADVMKGAGGNDIFYVDHKDDVTEEAGGGGTDTVYASTDYSVAGQNIEQLILTGAAIKGTGNGLANTITGNANANVLYGGGGSDTMVGGLGNDTFYVDGINDVVTEAAGEGNDTVSSSGTYVLGANLEVLRLTGSANINGTGNGLANTITGNTNNNLIDGGAGADTMKGGAGNDSYVVDNAGDAITELAGEGTDSVSASVTYTLGANVENLTLTGASAINGTGNTFANTLNGNTAGNTLGGGAGDDALHGGLGSDTLTGGTGLDTFWFETALGAGNIDTITDFAAVDDTIRLDRTIFAGIAADGPLAAGAFRLGTAAADADDRILYDAPTGRIFYDADGVGGAAAVLFAQVAPNTALTAADFFAVP